MTSASPQKPPGTNLSTRFRKPETAVAERIDQLTLAHPDEQDLRQSREQQASWLKREMAIHWNGDLPQPFIGFDLDEGLFVAEWQSDTECHTLTIDAEHRKARYDPWSPDASEIHKRIGLLPHPHGSELVEFVGKRMQAKGLARNFGDDTSPRWGPGRNL